MEKTVKGIVSNIEVKGGVSKTGKAYSLTKFTVNGVNYSTFEKVENVEIGHEVNIMYKENGTNKNIVSIFPVIEIDGPVNMPNLSPSPVPRDTRQRMISLGQAINLAMEKYGDVSSDERDVENFKKQVRFFLKIIEDLQDEIMSGKDEQ